MRVSDSTDATGPLVIIGGGEDRRGKKLILAEIARLIGGGKLVIATIASHDPRGYFDQYRKAFSALGVGSLSELYIAERLEARDPARLAILDDAAGVFFTGGDQLRITSQIGDTPIERRVREIHRFGGLIAGTSAGASVMSETMLVKGSSAVSHRIGDLHMAPGLGLIGDVIIDQHFAERGRFGRLVGAVALNPRGLGLGIDEDTAVVVDGGMFRVLGRGCVCVIDGSDITHSNVAEARPKRALSLHGLRVHVLSTDETFQLRQRRPCPVLQE